MTEIERMKAVLARVTDGRHLIIDTGTGGPDTTPPPESSAHVLYGSKQTRSLRVTDGGGLDIDFEQGQAWVGGTFYFIGSGSLTMTDASTNNVFVGTAGVVAFNTTTFPEGSIPLATVVTAGADITSVNDRRSYLLSGAASAGAPHDADQLIDDDGDTSVEVERGADDDTIRLRAATVDVAFITSVGQWTLPVAGSGGGVFMGGDVALYRGAADALHIPDDVFVLDDQGIVVGHTAKIDFGAIPEFQVLGTATPDSSMGFARFEDNDAGPDVRFLKSRGVAIGDNVIVQDNDRLGRFRFQGADGLDFNTTAAELVVRVDGAPAANDIPGRFIFRTRTAGGALSDKMLLTEAGQLELVIQGITGGILLGGDAQLYRSAADVLAVGVGDTLRIDDANFTLAMVGGDPRITFDTNDRIEYDRATNVFSFYAAGLLQAQIHNVGTIAAGVNHSRVGRFRAWGAGSGSTVGGKFELYNAADHDATFEFWGLYAVSDDLQIFSSDNAVINVFTAEGQLQLPTQGSGGGLLVGDDVLLYRSAADVLRTPDSMTIEGVLLVDTINEFTSAVGVTIENVTIKDGSIELHHGTDTISTDEIDAPTGGYIIAAAQTGTTDDLDGIGGGANGRVIVVRADAGDTITVKHNNAGGAAGQKILLNDNADLALTGNDEDTIFLMYDESLDSANGAWFELTRAAFTSHVHDASVLTYTPAVLGDWDGDADPGDVDDALDQLAERTDDLEGFIVAGFHANRATSQTITTGTFTAIVFTAEDYDPQGVHDTATGVFTVPAGAGGVYAITATVSINITAADIEVIIGIFVGGVEISRGVHTETHGSGIRGVTVTDFIELAAADTVDIRIFHNRGSNQSTEASAKSNYFAAHRVN